MNDSDRKKFYIIMHGLAINAGKELLDDQLDFYFKALKQFDIEQIETAAKDILLTWKTSRLPPLAVFIESIMGKGSDLAIEDRALVQANKMIEHLHRYGANKWPAFDDPITKYLMTYRWPYNRWGAELLESETHWWIKEFIEAYRAHSQDSGKQLLSAPDKIKELASGLFKSIE